MIGKNISKKLAIVAVSVVLSAMSCMSVCAETTRYEIGWSEDPCPTCHEDVAVWITEVHHDPYATGVQRICLHYRFGVDVEKVERIVTEYKCQECKKNWSTEREVTYWKCHGADKEEEL